MTEQPQNGNGDSTQDKKATVPVVNLLDDKPEDKDLTGGGHQRVADAIARLIEREKGGKAIALEGSWGSGKSSVVRMLEKACGDDTVVYTFDAWKHEADPLRIAFLRGLFERLKKRRSKPEHEPWIKPGHHRAWKRALDRFERGSGVTRNVHAALLRKKDLAAIWALLTAPIILAAGVAAFASSMPDVARYITAGLAALLALTIASIPLWSIGKAPGGFPSTEYDDDPSDESEPSVAQIMLTRQPAHVVTRFSGPPPVTSLSFERLFKLLVRRALQADKDRQLVIVVDNLDRLSPEDALNVWTTMRVFLEMDQQASPWLDRFWLVVPYDRTALASLWNGSPRAQDHSAEHPQTDAPEGDDLTRPKIHHSRPSSFLDKTFAIRFDVPPLLLASWEEALGGYLQEAFGKDLPANTIKSIARLSRRFASEQHHPPTPRHLKLFVNDIGALVRQHGSAFPLETLAAYAILRRAPLNPEGIREDLRSDRKDINRYLGAGWLDEDRSVHLACLVFNTHDVELARELLLVEPIGQAIGEGDRETLELLLANPAAESVLEDSTDKVLGAIGRDSTFAIESGFEVLEDMRERLDSERWDLLSQVAEVLYPESVTMNEVHKIPDLCRRVALLAPNPTTLARLTRDLANIPSRYVDYIPPQTTASAWASLWHHGGDTVQTDSSMKVITIPSGADYAINFLSTLFSLNEAGPQLWSRLTSGNLDALTKILLPEDVHEGWSEEQWHALIVVAHCREDAIDWEAAAERLADYIEHGEDEGSVAKSDVLLFLRGSLLNGERLGAMKRAHVASKSSPFTLQRKRLVDSGILRDRLDRAVESGALDCAAQFILEMGVHEPLVESARQDFYSRFEHKTIAQLLDKPEQFDSLLGRIASSDWRWLRTFLQLQVTEEGSANVAAAVLSRMPDDAIRVCMHQAWVVRHWSRLQNALHIAPTLVDPIIRAHQSGDSPKPKALSRQLAKAGVTARFAGLASRLASYGALDDGLRDQLHEQFYSMDKEAWFQDIMNTYTWHPVLCAMQVEDLPGLGEPFCEGLILVAQELRYSPSRGEHIDGQMGDKLAAAIAPAHRLTFRRSLHTLALRTDYRQRTPLYTVFGRAISEDMLENPDTHDVNVLLNPAIEGVWGGSPSWLESFLLDSRARDTVAASPIADRDRLFQLVHAMAKAEPHENRPYSTFLRNCEGLEGTAER